jgi:hypothetical protein
LLETIAWLSILVALACALWITLDEIRHPQKMAVMNLVWPLTALYFSVFAVWAYYRWGRTKIHGMKMDNMQANRTPTLSQVAVGTSHCGAGCMAADVLCEFAIAAAGITLFGSMLWAEFAIDFAAAWALGIVFQYYAIRPMSDMPASRVLIAAIKADTLSILAFQTGMYATMAWVYFKLFPHPHLTAFQPQYWLLMQAAMIAGYATSFPMNGVLIKAGIKEAM